MCHFGISFYLEMNGVVPPSPAATASSSSRIATSDSSDSVIGSSVDFACLYTKHKTQKRKVYQDGRLVLRNMRVSLYTAIPALGNAGDPVLDESELTMTQCQALRQRRQTRLETERYLIEVEGLWVPTSCNPSTSRRPMVSNGMKKLLSRKFQKPGAYIPPQSQQPIKRLRRPLQPGELHRRHYGTTLHPPSHHPQHPATSNEGYPSSYDSSHLDAWRLSRQQTDSSREEADRESPTEIGLSAPGYLLHNRNTGNVPPSSLRQNPFVADPMKRHSYQDPLSAHAKPLDVASAARPLKESQQLHHRQANFVSNGFDPNSVYGDEEHQEEEENGREGFHWDKESAPLSHRRSAASTVMKLHGPSHGDEPPKNNRPASDHHMKARSANVSILNQSSLNQEDGTTSVAKDPASRPPVHRAQESRHSTSKSNPRKEPRSRASKASEIKPLSRNELLALFGARKVDTKLPANSLAEASTVDATGTGDKCNFEKEPNSAFTSGQPQGPLSTNEAVDKQFAGSLENRRKDGNSPTDSNSSAVAPEPFKLSLTMPDTDSSSSSEEEDGE